MTAGPGSQEFDGVNLGGILALAPGIEAVLFDMDGVILDTLGADYDLCVRAAVEVTGDGAWVRRDVVRAYFALEPDGFWRELEKNAKTPIDDPTHERLVAVYDGFRSSAEFQVLPGIQSLMADARAAGLKIAIASSNDEEVVKALAARAGVAEAVDAIAGIAGDNMRGKPAPDIYQRAAQMVNVPPSHCAYIEDSATGLRSGRAAGCKQAIAVATGALSVDALEQLDLADIVFDRFEPPSLGFHDGDPARKTIDTPNDFVSHMIEHIAWRMGTGIDIRWRNNDWVALGRFLGEGLLHFEFTNDAASTLGMIDDGAAEVLIDRKAGDHGAVFSTHHSLPAEQVLAMRVEQVRAGQQLVDFADGFAKGFGARIEIRLCTFEDPHHSWEGVFRAIGIALARLRRAV